MGASLIPRHCSEVKGSPNCRKMEGDCGWATLLASQWVLSGLETPCCAHSRHRPLRMTGLLTGSAMCEGVSGLLFPAFLCLEQSMELLLPWQEAPWSLAAKDSLSAALELKWRPLWIPCVISTEAQRRSVPLFPQHFYGNYFLGIMTSHPTI